LKVRNNKRFFLEVFSDPQGMHLTARPIAK
jgi:hypothetical protein